MVTFDIYRDRVRIEFTSADRAREYQKKYGGHIFVGNEQIAWYSLAYTPTEVLLDSRGEGVLNPRQVERK